MNSADDLSIDRLCSLARVSRSGFYTWKKRPLRTPDSDERKIIRLFKKGHSKDGYRTLKMKFDRQEKRTINIKKVRRIKRDFNLFTKRRSPNKYRAVQAKGAEHAVAPNLVKRNFCDQNLLLLDITEVRIQNGQKAFIFAAKNGLTREIVAFNVAAKPTTEFVLEAIEKFLKNNPCHPMNFMIHSDQGLHFTYGEFRNLLIKWGVKQSMSRKGNCLDNASIESFFGHMKDEFDYRDCQEIKELYGRLKKYIQYYNNERPQWTLKQKTPAEAGVNLSLIY